MPNNKANSGALNVAPGDLNDSDHRREPTFGEVRPVARDRKALVAPDRDAEQVAFQLWREGRRDEAIAFLEREILLERDFAWKHSATRREPGFGAAAPEVIVPPPPDASKRRRRLLGAPPVVVVSEPAFSDASAPMIELAAEPVADRRAPSLVSTAAEAAGAMPPPEIIAALQGGRIGRGPAWIAAIGLVVICFAAVANYWDSQNDAPVPSLAASVTDVAAPAGTADAAPVAQDPVVTGALAAPATESAGSTDSGTAAATMMPAEATATAEIPARADDSTDAAAEILPAAQDTTDVELANVEEPVTPDAAETAAASAEDPAALDDLAPPPDESAPADESLEDESALEGEPAPIVTARLPRQRPEPPAAASLAVASPAVALAPVPKVAAVAPPRPARATSAPDTVGPGPIADLPQPFYDPSGEPRRETLTPEEYQALLERGALVDETMPPRRRALLRLLRR